MDSGINHNPLCLTRVRHPCRTTVETRKSSYLKENQLTAKRCLQAIVLTRVFRCLIDFLPSLGDEPYLMPISAPDSSADTRIQPELSPDRAARRRLEVP
jgi:hypothetical protein